MFGNDIRLYVSNFLLDLIFLFLLNNFSLLSQSFNHIPNYLLIYLFIYVYIYLSIYLPSLSLSISAKLVFSWDHANLPNSQVKLVFWKVFNLNIRATCVLFCTKRPLPIDLSVNPSVSVRRSVVTESLLSTNCSSERLF